MHLRVIIQAGQIQTLQRKIMRLQGFRRLATGDQEPVEFRIVNSPGFDQLRCFDDNSRVRLDSDELHIPVAVLTVAVAGHGIYMTGM